MSAPRLLLLLVLALVTVPAWAQITITESALRAQFYGGSFTVTEYAAVDPTTLQAVADLAGDNQTFDFRNATYEQEAILTSEQVECAGDIPGCDDPALNTANVILRSSVRSNPDSTGYFFGQLGEDGLYVLGMTAEGELDPGRPGLEQLALTFTPAQLAQMLPASMGTAWEADVMVTLQTNVGVGYSYRAIDEYRIDAWGMLDTPGGSAAALRLWNRTITMTDFGGILFTDTTITLTYLTRGAVTATITLDAQGHVTDGGYTVLEPATANEPSHGVPARIALEPNYPNPFNPSTTITYTLYRTGPIRLAVCDLLGREVAVLVDGVRSAGTYQVAWEAGDRPSGAYLYRLTAGEASVTRLMTLLK